MLAVAAAAQGALEGVELELPTHCSGCGVTLQQEDPEAPGYFQVPRKLLERLAAAQDPWEEDDSELVFDEERAEEEEQQEQGTAAGVAGAAAVAREEGEGDEGPSTSGRGEEEDGAWDAWDAVVESWLAGGGSERPRVEIASYAEQEGGEEGDGADAGPVNVLCARCYSLRHYGQVKSRAAEEALPEFDFERKIVLMVVDVVDFDGSLPRTAIKSLLAAVASPDAGAPGAGGGARQSWAGSLPRGFRLVVAVNKADLLPSQVTEARLEQWVRRRMAQGGLPRPSAVHIVSSTRRRGVRELLADLQAAVGLRGDVWVVGAQNAGKSSLINAMRQVAGLRQELDVTTAPLPGTTLGTLRVRGLLPAGCKMLDTPGVPHAFQLASWLTAEEMRMVLPRRPLRPRTFRAAPGQSVSVGGLARIDVLESPGATLYLSVFVSDEVACHFGKTDGAEERYAKHLGAKLAPPLASSPDRLAAFPALAPTEVEVAGDGWQAASVDVALAGLGWVAVGVKGAARLRVWAPPGVAITTHDALVPDYARDLERPGFGAALTDAAAAAAAAAGGGAGGKKKGGGGGGKRRGGGGKRP
eukprot:scaffold2.g7378.t1